LPAKQYNHLKLCLYPFRHLPWELSVQDSDLGSDSDLDSPVAEKVEEAVAEEVEVEAAVAMQGYH